MLLKQFFISVQSGRHRAQISPFFRNHSNLFCFKINVEGYWSCHACFRLNRVHRAFTCLLVKEAAEQVLIHGWIAIAFLRKWVLQGLSLFLQVLNNDFFPLFGQRRFCVLAANDFALSANVKRVSCSFVVFWHWFHLFRGRVHCWIGI